MSQLVEPNLTAGPAAEARPSLFGSLAFAGAAGSLAFCYGQVLISLMAPLLGLADFTLNIHVQAVFMWGFALVTVVGLYRDRRRHGRVLPLLISAIAVAVIVFTLYGFYDIRILILGYVLLVIAALLNQSMMLASLNGEVESRARALRDLNDTLEQRVERQVAEIDRLARLKRFLSNEVADLITSEGRESLLDSHRAIIACLFCDVRNFTAFSDSVEPEEVMDLLQMVHEQMGALVAEYEGTIGYRAGDGLMVIFNDPVTCDEPVARAVRLALAMKRAFVTIQARWHRLGHDIGFGIGVAYGYATLGLIGAEGRFDYTAIGNVVNIASRLCDAAADGEILIDSRARLEIEADARTEPVGELDLKGVGRPVEAHRVTALAGVG